MNTINRNGVKIALPGPDTKINTAQDALELMASAWYEAGCACIVLEKSALSEAFFDLKSGLAGDILQKFSNYSYKLAIVGDFSGYNSRSLRDFIYECNNGSLVFFKSSVEEALEALAPIR